jgi:hypothetical protein
MLLAMETRINHLGRDDFTAILTLHRHMVKGVGGGE